MQQWGLFGSIDEAHLEVIPAPPLASPEPAEYSREEFERDRFGCQADAPVADEPLAVPHPAFVSPSTPACAHGVTAGKVCDSCRGLNRTSGHCFKPVPYSSGRIAVEIGAVEIVPGETMTVIRQHGSQRICFFHNSTRKLADYITAD